MSCRKLLIDRFLALYGPPQTENPALFFAEWQRIYDGVDVEILTAAVNRLVKQHQYPTWPTIGEFDAIFEDVRAAIEARLAALRLRLAPPEQPKLTSKQRAMMQERMAQWKRDVLAAALLHSTKATGHRG